MKTQEAIPAGATTSLLEVADTRLKRREFCNRLLLTSSALLVGDSFFSFKAEGGSRSMGSISVACYKPRPGREAELLELVRNHLPPLRAEKLVTDRVPIMMRTADGTIVEIFEWVSPEAIEGAHKNPVVLDLWKKFESVCFYETPSNLKEFQNMFAHFEPI